MTQQDHVRKQADGPASSRDKRVKCAGRVVSVNCVCRVFLGLTMRCLTPFFACHCLDDVCFWARMPCNGRLKRDVRILALRAGVYEVIVLRFDLIGTCMPTS